MTDLQAEARALGDPTRHELFRDIASAGRPLDVAELTARRGVHHNAIRQHLRRLVDVGLVAEGTARPVGRGRPRLVYTLSPAAEGRWGVPGPYERLALLLSEMIRTGDTPVEVGRRAGRRVLIPVSDAADPVVGLVAAMAHHGFDPEVSRGGTRAEIVLRACPFESTALADPETVCGLHLGLAHGLAESLDGLAVDGIERHDPRRASCRLRCHVEPRRTDAG